MKTLLKGTEQLKKNCTVKTADWLFWQSSLPHPHLPSGCFQEVVSPSLPRRGLKCLPHPHVPISKRTQVRFQARLSSHLLQGGSGQPMVRTVSRGDGCPCVPTSWKPMAFSLPSYAKWTHVIECTWLSHVLLPTWAAQRARTSYLDSGTNKGSCGHKSLLQL